MANHLKKRRSQPSPAKTQEVKRDANATLRATHAMQLIARGMTYEQASAMAGYSSRGACHNAVQRELQRVATTNVVEFRQLTAHRLNLLLQAVWPLAVPAPDENGTPPANLFAVDRVLAIIKSQRDLMGIDTPVSDTISGVTIIREYNVEVGKV